MVGLYIRLQVFPESMPAWLTVPIPHVIDLILHSPDSSTLTIHQHSQRIGTLYIRTSAPKVANETRQLLLNGELSPPIPGTPQRMTFRSRMDISEALGRIQAMYFILRINNPGLEFRLDLDEGGSITYSLDTADGQPIQSASGTLDELLANTPLASSGFSLQRIRSIADNASPPTAHRATAKLAGESIPVYRLTLPHGESLTTHIDVSQLGRVLRISTPFGVTLLAEGIEP